MPQYDYVVEVIDTPTPTFGNLGNNVQVVETVLAGPQGPPGPVLLLDHGASVPAGTTPGTIIFMKDA